LIPPKGAPSREFQADEICTRVGFAFERFRHMSVDLRPEALRIGALCEIWANSKFLLLARSSRADRVGQQATQGTASTGMSGRIPISSEELL